MNCIELSLEKLTEKVIEFGTEMKKEYVPDLIVFIARGGYPIAKPLSELFNVPLIGVKASRKGNALKEKISFLFKYIPNFVRNKLIALELKTNIHGKNNERNVEFIDDSDVQKYSEVLKILIVDDSIDTGESLKAVEKLINQSFKNAKIKSLGLNVWKKSESVIKTDYAIYEDTIIKAPMSKDSREYDEFNQIYNDYLKKIVK